MCFYYKLSTILLFIWREGGGLNLPLPKANCLPDSWARHCLQIKPQAPVQVHDIRCLAFENFTKLPMIVFSILNEFTGADEADEA